MQIRKQWLVLAAATVAMALIACEPSEQEQAKFPRADSGAFKSDRRISEMHFVQLENGVSFYLKEDHQDDRVAIEVFYDAGFFGEPEGKIQVAHLAEHLGPKGATASYKAGEQIPTILRFGLIAAEVAGDCVHYDFIAPADKVDQTLAMEIERITSLNFDEALLQQEAMAAAAEFPSYTSGAGGASLTRYSFMALNQAYNYSADFVPIHEGTFTITADDVLNYRATHYRTEDIVVILVGGIDFATGEALVRKHFGALEPSPEPEPLDLKLLTKSKTVPWDLGTDAVYHLYPGPYTDYRERLMLTMFGAFMNSSIKRSENLHEIAVTTYSTNLVYPVRKLPFFVFGRPQDQSSPDRLSEFLDEQLLIAMNAVDERLLTTMKRNLTDFVTSTMVAEDIYHHEMMRTRVIGQEAVNTGIKHLLREGKSIEEFVELVNTVTLEEIKEVLGRVCAPERKIDLRFVPAN